MNLHVNKKLFMDAIAVTSQRMDIQEIFVEKDYWICYALNLIFQSQMKEEAIFKGGTALSKCYQLIDRFSEDIDLVILRHGEESGNQLKNKLKKITQTIEAPLTEQDIEGITHKLGMIRKMAYNYPKMLKGNFGQVRDTLIIEATWLGHFEPYSKKMISSYIYEMMVETGQAQMAEQYGLQPFEALVLDAERTLCEKIMSLVRFSYSENPIQDLRNKIRHLYDIHQLIKDGTLQGFFGSPDFETMLLKVIDDDVQSFKNNNDWLDHHPKEALIFKQPKETWDQLKGTYQNEFKELVFGEFPKEEEIGATIILVAKRLEALKL